ncbi:hypothetical protein ACJ7K1_23210 [Paenibacillus elgii]
MKQIIGNSHTKHSIPGTVHFFSEFRVQLNPFSFPGKTILPKVDNCPPLLEQNIYRFRVRGKQTRKTVCTISPEARKGQSANPNDVTEQLTASVASYSDTFMLGFIISIIAVVVSLFLRKNAKEKQAN